MNSLFYKYNCGNPQPQIYSRPIGGFKKHVLGVRKLFYMVSDTKNTFFFYFIKVFFWQAANLIWSRPIGVQRLLFEDGR